MSTRATSISLEASVFEAGPVPTRCTSVYCEVAVFEATILPITCTAVADETSAFELSSQVLHDTITMDEAIREAYAYADPGNTIYECIQISHPSWIDDILLVDSYDPLTTNIGTYHPVHMSCKVPETEGAVRGQLSIELSFLPQAYLDKIYAAALDQDPIEIRYYQYLNGAMDPSAQLPVSLTVTDMEHSVGNNQTKLNALFPDLVNTPFCRTVMTTSIFPGGRVW